MGNTRTDPSARHPVAVRGQEKGEHSLPIIVGEGFEYLDRCAHSVDAGWMSIGPSVERILHS